MIREATTALRTHTLPADLPWSLLADPDRAEVRRAGYRLLNPATAYDQLRADLIAAADPDPRLARRGAADATRILRDATATIPRRGGRPDFKATPAQVAELIDLAHRAAGALGPRTAERLTTWLTTLAA